MILLRRYAHPQAREHRYEVRIHVPAPTTRIRLEGDLRALGWPARHPPRPRILAHANERAAHLPRTVAHYLYRNPDTHRACLLLPLHTFRDGRPRAFEVEGATPAIVSEGRTIRLRAPVYRGPRIVDAGPCLHRFWREEREELFRALRLLTVP